MSEPAGRRIGVVIVEDEERARGTLRDLVSEDGALELLAETAGRETPAVIERYRPDIILLDVQMPGMDGFDILRAIAPEQMPVVILVTAYDRYALDAFEFAALDYLLKPFSDDRFSVALARAKQAVHLRRTAREGTGDIAQRVQRLLDVIGNAQERLTLRDGSRTLLVSPREIDWVEADGVYVRLHVGKRNTLLRQSLSALEERLSRHGFFRVHRSALVNLDRVVELKHRSHGDYAVRLRDGTELTLARTRKDALEERLSLLHP